MGSLCDCQTASCVQHVSNRRYTSAWITSAWHVIRPRASELPRCGLGARTRGNLCTDGSTTRAWCPGRRHHPSPGARAIRNNPAPTTTGPDGSRDALTGRCETFDGDGCRHDSHRAKVHDPDDQEDRHQTGTAVAAVESETQAVSSGRARVGRQRTAAPGCLPAAGQVTRLPRAELERVGDEDDHADRDRNGARQRRLLHLDRRQRDAQRKGGHSEHGPHEEVTHAHPFGTPGCAFRAAFLPGVKQAGRARFPNRKPLIGSKTCGMPPQPTYLTNMDFSSVVAGRLSFSRSRKEPDCFDVCPAFLFEFERSFANFIAVCDAITWPDCGAVLRARVADRSLGFGRQEDVSLPHRFPRLVVRLLLRHLSLLHQLPP